MCTTRRQFINSTALGSLSLAASPVLTFDEAFASDRLSPLAPGAATEHMASASASFFRPYSSTVVDSPDVKTWVQIDLGSTQTIEAVKLYPFCKPHSPPGEGFPLRFRLECSDDANFKVRQLIADCTKADYADPEDRIVAFPAKRAAGRYLRLTATRLRALKPSPLRLMFMDEAAREKYLQAVQHTYFFCLAKIEVLAQGVDLALHRPVTVDEIHGNPEDAQQLTRLPRPQGEGLITDNPQNVTSPQDWRPVAYRAQAPREGIEVRSSLFKTALDNNIRYLLDSFSNDDLLRPFRQRAGQSLPPPTRAPHTFWDEQLAGQNAGRFLMGSGNTLRWVENRELRDRMNALVDGIAECRQANGYIMAYPEDTLFVSERGAYTRAWVTHGLIEAGYAGNGKAFELLRGYYDWYNQTSYLPRALRGCNFGPQGTVANTRMYFTPLGKPVDLQVVQQYLQENYWLEDLAARKPEAIWQYPYDRPHCYLITFMEPYLDLYRATGDRRYLDAVLGGWNLIRENWQSMGGSIALQEGESCPPKANPLYEKHRGET